MEDYGIFFSKLMYIIKEIIFLKFLFNQRLILERKIIKKKIGFNLLIVGDNVEFF